MRRSPNLLQLWMAERLLRERLQRHYLWCTGNWTGETQNRRNSPWSPKRVAAKIGISMENLHRWEQGRVFPRTLDLWHSWVSVYDLELGDLINEFRTDN